MGEGMTFVGVGEGAYAERAPVTPVVRGCKERAERVGQRRVEALEAVAVVCMVV
jgi:hypothetical protein